jgi:hypothetical protein
MMKPVTILYSRRKHIETRDCVCVELDNRDGSDEDPKSAENPECSLRGLQNVRRPSPVSAETKRKRSDQAVFHIHSGGVARPIRYRGIICLTLYAINPITLP